MKSLVIYDSRFGNTRQLADAIAARLRREGSVDVVECTQALPSSFEGIDLLVVGGPTHGHRDSEHVRELTDRLPKHSLDGISAAAFDTRFDKPRWLTGSAAGRIDRHLHRAGATMVAEPESFFIVASEGPLAAGELERAAQWAGLLLEQARARQPAGV